MFDEPIRPTISATISNVSGQVAVGTDIRQQAIHLAVEIASGDPAALDLLAQKIRLDPIDGPVMAWGRDFPRLIGRDADVGAAREALARHGSVSTYGEDGIGKTVFLRHLARRSGGEFGRGVAVIAAAGNRWQDVAQDVVQSFFRTAVPIRLGPAQLRVVLGDLDALLLLDDVDPVADIDQLFALAENASFVVGSSQRLLAGESRAVHLVGLDPAGTGDLIRETLGNLGDTSAVDDAVAAAIGKALGGHPGRIIRAVEDAAERKVGLTGLAAELAGGASAAARASLSRIGSSDAAVVEAVAALDGTPVGAEHVAAIAGTTTEATDELLRRRVLRAASPQVRLDPDLAAARSSRDTPSGPDDLRARFLDHFVRWAQTGADGPAAIADESRAITYLIRWASSTGRFDAVRSLSRATEGAFALANRWGAWAEVTDARLAAARALDDPIEASLALNQQGVLALGDDATDRARAAFGSARSTALVAGSGTIAAVAESNLRLIDGLLLPPHEDEPRPDEDRKPRSDDKPVTDDPLVPRWLVALGVVALLAVVAVIVLLLNGRPALAIEPAAHVFTPTSVETDGERVVFTITNRGGSSLDGLAPTLSGDAADQFFIVGGTCPGTSLRGGQACTVELLFHPTHPGVGRATLAIGTREGTAVTAAIESQASEPTASVQPSASVAPSPSELASLTPRGRPDLAIVSFAPTGEPKGEISGQCQSGR